jgi:hypothetical protein
MATLIDVATPGPALAAAQSSTNNVSSTSQGINILPTAVACPSTTTYYKLNSISLGAGTWAICGCVVGVGGDGSVIPVVSLASGSSTPAGQMQTNGDTNVAPYIVSYGCVVKLTGTTTVYINVKNNVGSGGAYWQATMYAVKIA